MNYQYVEIDEVYKLHQKIIKLYNSKAFVRDFGLLHSAVERPKATFEGNDLYPNLFSKAAALLQSLTRSHPFTDGNKRTAWTAPHLFLWLNGYHLKAETKEIVAFVISVDNEKPEIGQITSWLKDHSKKRTG